MWDLGSRGLCVAVPRQDFDFQRHRCAFERYDRHPCRDRALWHGQTHSHGGVMLLFLHGPRAALAAALPAHRRDHMIGRSACRWQCANPPRCRPQVQCENASLIAASKSIAARSRFVAVRAMHMASGASMRQTRGVRRARPRNIAPLSPCLRCEDDVKNRVMVLRPAAAPWRLFQSVNDGAH